MITAQPVDTETVKTEFEIDIIVRANSLRVVTEAGGEELVGTVTRGDRVVQLAHASEGWSDPDGRRPDRLRAGKPAPFPR